MRIAALTFSLFFCLFACAHPIVCPRPDQVRVTQGWALTVQGASMDWDGTMGKDNEPLGALNTMDLSYAPWLNGYIIHCRYNNGQISNIAPIKGVCSPKGTIQNCQEGSCVVHCNDSLES